uniref:Heat shock protein 70 n=1 Tax=Panagrolaimus sp. PS1159 TaxID=55785 RepID=A0AC35GH92_9BILA
MTVHVGMFPYEGTASYNNDIKKETLDLQICKVEPHEIKKISLMFEEIKSKINDKQFGCACICIDEFCGNTYRKRLIEEAFKYGFKNVEIINRETAIYLNAMSQIKYKPLNGNKTKNDVFKFMTRIEEETIELPVSNKIYLTLKIDVNEIYYITITEHAKGLEEKPLDENKTSSTTNDTSNASIFQNQQFSTVRFYNLSSKTDLSNKNMNAVGIDLGTSRCCAAVRKKNGIETIALDNTGERLLPSFVAYDEEKVICGIVAVKRLRNSYKSTIYDSKRIIGRKINEIEIDSFWPFGLSEKSGKVQLAVQKFNVSDKTQIQGCVSPEEVAADLLKLIKNKAEEIQGTSLKNCVITVPAAFNDSQKAATIKAAEIAGWKDVILLPEPIAAAFAYFHGRPIPSNSNVLIFDLGGGTLDVCIFKIKNDRLQVISNTGDSKFGGRDFDTVLINYFKNALSTKYGINLVKNKKYLLMIKCQEIKESLSILTKANLDIDEFDTNQDGIISVTREEFEKMTQSLLNKVENTLIAALYKPKLYANQIDKVLLVGGGSRMPMIKDLLKEKFPKAEHCCHEHPDEVVAIGAAHYACNLQKQGDSGKEENCSII